MSLNSRLKNMSLELELDRELLARKNRQLQFLNTLLHQASTTLDLNRILEVAHSVIDAFIELEVSCALFWSLDEKDQAHGDLYIPHCLAEEVQGLWISHLLDQARALLSRPVADYQLNTFAVGGRSRESRPGQSVFTFPLQVHSKLFGCLCLKPVDPHVGQDIHLSLRLAAQHLALIFQNAQHFARIRKEADHDGLTQINNRQHFDKRLKEEIKRHQRHGQPLSLLMLDVDHFKDINDTYGHQAGDMVLQALGRLLNTSLRASDFSARYGGEEFTVILPQTAREQALKLAERLRKEVADRDHLFEGQTFAITVSLGVASFDPSSPASPYTIVSRADRALYRAKERGRNTVVCASEDHDPLSCVDKSSPPSQTERHEHA
jgi:diguanylate cyclase (GGDEF)-like protein